MKQLTEKPMVMWQLQKNKSHSMEDLETPTPSLKSFDISEENKMGIEGIKSKRTKKNSSLKLLTQRPQRLPREQQPRQRQRPRM